MAAVTQSTMAVIDALLKEQYVGPIESALNTEIPLSEAMGDDNRKPSGKGIVFPVTLQFNTSSRAMGETDQIPTANRSVEKDATVLPVQLTGKLQLTQKVLKNAADDTDAFTADLEYEMERLRDGAKNDLERQLHGREQEVSNAYVTGVMAALTATCANGATTATVDSTQFFNEGDQIAIGTNSDLSGSSDAAVGTAIVTGITSSTVLAIEALAGPGGGDCSSGDYICKGTGSSAKNAYNKELLGLDFGIDDDSSITSFEGIDQSAYPRWRAYVAGNSGTPRDLSLELMQGVLSQVDIKSGREPTHIVMHQTHRDQYVELLTPQVRYEPRAQKGGFKGALTYQGGKAEIPILVSRFSKLGTIYFADMKSVKKNWSQKMGWMQEDGAVLSRVPNYTSYEATLVSQLAVCWRNRVTSGKLTDLST